MSSMQTQENFQNDTSSQEANSSEQEAMMSRLLDLQERNLILQGKELDLKEKDLDNQKHLAEKNLDLYANDLQCQRAYKFKLVILGIVFSVFFMIFLAILAYWGKDDIIKTILTFILGALSGAGFIKGKIALSNTDKQ